MPEDVYMQFINGTIKETTASTLVELEILTGCTIAGMVKKEAISMELREIILEAEPARPGDLPGTGATESFEFALATESGLSAIPEISDIHCIYKFHRYMFAGVATYLPLIMGDNAYPPYYQWPSPLLIPHPKIYAYLIATNASILHEVKFRIGFTYVQLEAAEIMEALEVWRSPTA